MKIKKVSPLPEILHQVLMPKHINQCIGKDACATSREMALIKLLGQASMLLQMVEEFLSKTLKFGLVKL